MESCHPYCIELLKSFLGSIVHRSLFRALDVSGGDGRLSTYLLLRCYRKVDLFDQCPVAIEKAKQSMRRYDAFGHLYQSTMQEFDWHFSYSAIFMVWCSGYLTRSELVAFLRKANTKLIEDSGRVSRQRTPESFIFLFENVLEEHEESIVIKDQRLRTVSTLESIYNEAGLLVHRCSGP